MKYAASCFLALVVAVSLNIGAPDNTENEFTQTETQQVSAVEITETDASFAESNPIVYQALLDIEDSYNKLCVLEESGVNVGSYKADAYALAEYVRSVGNSKTVNKVELPGQSLNSAETVVYCADSNKGAWVTNAAAYASYKELFSETAATVDGTLDNAKKHVKWSATAVILSGDAQYTKYFTDAHELGHPANFLDEDNFLDSDMDMKNNAVGRDVGQQLRKDGRIRAIKNLDSQIEQCHAEGKLTVLE